MRKDFQEGNYLETCYNFDVGIVIDKEDWLLWARDKWRT